MPAAPPVSGHGGAARGGGAAPAGPSSPGRGRGPAGSGGPAPGGLANREITSRLREAADLLAQQGANPFRVQAYRRAAATVEHLDRPLAEIAAREGIEGLVALPTIGSGIGRAIDELLRTGNWSFLDRLRGTLDPEALFRSLPGVGPELAGRLHDALDVDSLEGLEVAAHDGRLERVPGIGPRRAAGLRASLESRLGRRARPPRPGPDGHRPGVGDLLDVDAEYRRRAAAGELPTIAPRRFNPRAEAWLPVLHTTREGWHFTALFSNTARAHELGRTRDWVVIYYAGGDHVEAQCTVVTETRGALEGRRVVRGREEECRAHYAGAPGR
jgi:putative hydrolase